jgi:hypothetical protein
MSNTTLTADIIAKEAVAILENNCVMGKLVYRGYEDEFDNNINGYKVGETVSIRRPADFTVRSGATAAVQDVTEGKIPVTVDLQKGVDFKFTSSDLTLQIGDLSERVIKPAMIQLCNQIDRDVMSLYNEVPNHVTIPAGGINSFADFALAPELMDKMGIPQDERKAVLSPADYWAMVGSQTALYINGPARDAYRDGQLGMIANIDTYMSQNTPSHTYGSRTGTDLIDLTIVDGTFTWASAKDSTYITIHIDGANGATDTIKKGDTFTISDVYDVDPVSKAALAHLKMFVVMEDVTLASNEGDVKIWPPIILSGAHKTCHLSTGTDINDNTVTWRGTASTAFRESLFFRRNAFALTMVPMVKPPGAIDVGRRSYKGYSVRVIPYYDGTNDESNWRLDVLYGVDAIDTRQAVRASTAADLS